MKIQLTRQASRDLDKLWVYVCGQNPFAADTLVGRILDAIEVLRAHPNAGRTGRVAGTRELVVSDTPYVVAYIVNRGRVTVVRVLHGARSWPRRI